MRIRRPNKIWSVFFPRISHCSRAKNEKIYVIICYVERIKKNPGIATSKATLILLCTKHRAKNILCGLKTPEIEVSIQRLWVLQQLSYGLVYSSLRIEFVSSIFFWLVILVYLFRLNYWTFVQSSNCLSEDCVPDFNFFCYLSLFFVRASIFCHHFFFLWFRFVFAFVLFFNEFYASLKSR